MINLPLLAIDFPGIASTVMGGLLLITNFDFPYIDADNFFGLFGEGFWDLGPDSMDTVLLDKPNSLLLQSGYDIMGYNTRYISRFLGSVFIVFMISIGILTTIFLTSLCKKKVPIAKKIHDALVHKFLWGFYIEMMSMPTIEYCLAGYMNLTYGSIGPDCNDG